MKQPFTQVPDFFLEALMMQRMSQHQFRVVLAIARWTWGYGEESRQITQTYLGQSCGLPACEVSRAVKALADLGIVRRNGDSYGLVGDPEDWKPRGEVSGIWLKMRKKKLALDTDTVFAENRELFKNNPEDAVKLLADAGVEPGLARRAVEAAAGKAEPWAYARAIVMGEPSGGSVKATWPEMTSGQVRKGLGERVGQMGVLGSDEMACVFEEMGYPREWVMFSFAVIGGRHDVQVGVAWQDGWVTEFCELITQKQQAIERGYTHGDGK